MLIVTVDLNNLRLLLFLRLSLELPQDFSNCGCIKFFGTLFLHWHSFVGVDFLQGGAWTPRGQVAHQRGSWAERPVLSNGEKDKELARLLFVFVWFMFLFDVGSYFVSADDMKVESK